MSYWQVFQQAMRRRGNKFSRYRNPAAVCNNPQPLVKPVLPYAQKNIDADRQYLDICLNIKTLNKVFKALNDPTRRDILNLLKQRNMTAGEIAEQFSMSWPSISHHLDLLKQAGLVDSEKKGQFVLYSLNMSVMDDLLRWVMQFSQNKKGGKHEK